MGNPLLLFWQRMRADPERQVRPGQGPRPPELEVSGGSATIFLILRRMRIPLIVLIVIFAVSVLGLSLTPGQDAHGRPGRLNIFESFYFMSYTATTIGFGEIPHAFTPAQRMWVTFAIFLSVIGWAYAVGSLLALVQDRAFRRAVARQRFVRAVQRLREPFYIVVGHGAAGQRLTRSLDAVGRRFVVVDQEDDRIAALELGAYHADAPAVVGSARDTRLLAAAGLAHPQCEGVLVLTGDDEANLAVTMAAALLRPDVRVIARTGSRAVGERMRAFGTPDVVNPFDRFGDHLRILLRSPASYQLMVWLTSPVGTELERRREPLPRGRWVVYGRGTFGTEIAADLRAEGLEVTVVGPDDEDGFDLDLLLGAGVEDAGGLVAATGSDTTNLSLVEAAAELSSGLFLVARQNGSGNAPLYSAVRAGLVLVPAEVLLHEILARLSNPLLLPFLRQVPHQGEAWSARLVSRLTDRCGTHLQDLSLIHLDAEEAPAVERVLEAGGVTLGDLLRRPDDRGRPVSAVVLMLQRDEETVLAPDDDVVLRVGDRLLLVGSQAAQRAVDLTLRDGATAEYVVGGRPVATGWLWRRLAGRRRMLPSGLR